jgi:2-keto-4-pentenoate hydratase/2-oxohepta-3-ene-1,7-dioic acid hydratase in catechol pathway
MVIRPMPAGAERVEIGAVPGIVFGDTCTRATEAAALSSEAGYTVANDLSGRGFGYGSDGRIAMTVGNG